MAESNFEDEAKASLVVNSLMSLKPLKLPGDLAARDGKLRRFLQDVEAVVNKMIRGVQRQTQLTAEELTHRPTYQEEFKNVRENVHRVVLGSFNEDWAESKKQADLGRSQTLGRPGLVARKHATETDVAKPESPSLKPMSTVRFDI